MQTSKPRRILIIGYNTRAEASNKGLITEDPRSYEIWYNPKNFFELSVVLIPFGRKNEDCMLTQTIRYIEWDFPRKAMHGLAIGVFIYLVKAISLIRKLIKEERLDVIKVNGPNISALIAIFFCFTKSIPTVLFIEAFWEKLLPSQKNIPNYVRMILPLWYRLVYRCFDIYSGTPSLEPDYYVALGMSRERISTWTQELNLDVLLSEVIKIKVNQDIINLPRPRLIAVGRLHLEKHPDDLIKVLSIVRMRFPTTQLILVGDGVEKKNLYELAEKYSVVDGLTITGSLSQASGLAVVNCCDVYVAPLQGNALVEAMSIGMPIVAYDNETHRNLIKHGLQGLITPNRDVYKMAEAVVSILEDETFAKNLGREAKNYATLNHDYETVAVKLNQSIIDAFNLKTIHNANK